MHALIAAGGQDEQWLTEEQLAASPARVPLADYQRWFDALPGPLREALELAEACGSQPLVEAVRSELYATGARPRITALSGPEALTASECRVAALAAEGQTNRDIAQALYVTPKTVEVHLTNAYRKLGIRSRRELPAAFAAD
jgi:DNA-binding NarL/FixJ family response regulator